MTDKSISPRIRYDEGCLAAHALNLIGDRWALLVVRELMFTPKRFQMIRVGLPGITASVLDGRLDQLRQAGVVQHDARLAIYSLTSAGHRLLPVLEALCRWALTVPGHDHTRFISPSALMISMGVTLRQDLAGEQDLRAGFDFGTESFEMHLQNGRLQTRVATQPDASFVLSGNGNALASAVYGKAPLSRMIEGKIVGVGGDLEVAQRFVNLFTLAV